MTLDGDIWLTLSVATFLRRIFLSKNLIHSVMLKVTFGYVGYAGYVSYVSYVSLGYVTLLL